MLAVVTSQPLRALQEDDAPTIQAWLQSYLTDHLAWWQQVFGRSPESHLSELVARDWQELVQAHPERQYVRVFGETTPLGIVFAEKRRDRYMGFEIGVLSWVYVDPAARGQGVSRVLMEAANTWMAAQGVQGREVFVTAQNTAAVKLYERHGFRVFDHRMLGSLTDEDAASESPDLPLQRER